MVIVSDVISEILATIILTKGFQYFQDLGEHSSTNRGFGKERAYHLDLPTYCMYLYLAEPVTDFARIQITTLKSGNNKIW